MRRFCFSRAAIGLTAVALFAAVPASAVAESYIKIRVADANYDFEELGRFVYVTHKRSPRIWNGRLLCDKQSLNRDLYDVCYVTSENSRVPPGTNGFNGQSPNPIITPAIVKILRENKKEIGALQARVDTLEQRVSTFETELEASLHQRLDSMETQLLGAVSQIEQRLVTPDP